MVFRRSAFVLLLFYGLFSPAFSQPNTGTLSFEPFLPLSGGFSLEAGVNQDIYRYSILISTQYKPSWFNPQSKEVEIRRNYIDLNATRFLNGDERGLHFGVNLGIVFKEKATRLDVLRHPTADILTKRFLRLGGRVGYIWHPWGSIDDHFLQPLFVEPSLTLGIALIDSDKTFVNGTILQGQLLQITGPMIMLGWKWDLGDLF